MKKPPGGDKVVQAKALKPPVQAHLEVKGNGFVLSVKDAALMNGIVRLLNQRGAEYTSSDEEAPPEGGEGEAPPTGGEGEGEGEPPTGGGGKDDGPHDTLPPDYDPGNDTDEDYWYGNKDEKYWHHTGGFKDDPEDDSDCLPNVLC
jgi:hypothetical protein